MALFNHGDQSEQVNHDKTTIITEGAYFKGELNVDCELFYDGEFEGVISSSFDVSIGEHGNVRGELFARKVAVLGSVEGEIAADRIEIKNGGRVKGIIISSELVIESGARFEGESRLKNAAEMPRGAEA